MANTLGLVGDGDDIDLLRGLEQCFGYRLSDGEAADCRTVADVYKILQTHFSSAVGEARSCASAMAFYRMRRTLVELGAPTDLRPTTMLSEIPMKSPKSLLREMSARTGLRFPWAAITKVGQLGRTILIIGLLSSVPVSGIYPGGWPLPVLLITLGLMLVRVDAGCLPPGVQTVGDLAHKVAGLNFGKMVAQGAAPRNTYVWDALVEVLSEHSGLPTDEIAPSTVLISRRFGFA